MSQARVQKASMIEFGGGKEGPLNRGSCVAPTRSESCLIFVDHVINLDFLQRLKAIVQFPYELVSTMSWDNFRTFNNKLKGQDVFKRFDRQSVSTNCSSHI